MIRVNGMASEVVPATDRGLAYGDGVFRTLAVRGGRAVHWYRHYAKLASDCARLGIACPAPEVVLADVHGVVEQGSDAAVKVIVTRGPGERGYPPPEPARPNRIVMSSPLPAYPEAHTRAGIDACLCRLRLGTQPALAGIKHLNRLENVLARAEWKGTAYAEGLLCDAQGHVVGGTMTNLFIVEEGRLYTPSVAHCGVAGVTRELILERGPAEGVPVETATIGLERLMACDEAFLVNSLIGAWRLRTVAGRAMREIGMTARIRAWLVDETGAPR